MALSKNLRLEVILAATDKLTGPLKKAMAGSKGLAAAVRASQTGLKDLQGQQQRLTAFRDLSRETKDTAIKLKAARLAGNTQVALDTARLLAKHRAFSPAASASVITRSGRASVAMSMSETGWCRAELRTQPPTSSA